MDTANMRNEIDNILEKIDAVSSILHEGELNKTEYNPDDTLSMINRRIEDAYAQLCEVNNLIQYL